MDNSNNFNDVENVNENSSNVKKSSFGHYFLKGYLICIGIGVALFFLCSIGKVLYDVFVGSSGESVFIRLIQIFVPMMTIFFGWIPGLVYAAIKDGKK